MSDFWPDDDFNAPGWHDNNEVIDPGGAAAGPGAIGPIPAQLVSSSVPGGYHVEYDDNGLMMMVPDVEPLDPGGASAGPGAGGGLAPISNTTNADGTPAGNPPGAASGAPFQINYAELEKFAEEHDLNAQELADWASGDPDFAERYLATHGKVNFGTYLKIKEFMASKQIAGTAFAQHNAQTSTALRSSIASTKAQEEANARAIDATRMV
ncbi:type VII secretion target [Mycobacterium sp. NPDC006124]|uniref:type VII secretion target n=1 Tax=Mycobacterium sp. NPDC006124 TaxID=3156729 RepID=UPI0033B54B3D